MAKTIETLEVIVKANASQFKSEMITMQKQLAGLQNLTGGVSSSMTGSGGLIPSFTIGTIAANVITSTISKLSGAFFDLGQQIVANGTELGRIRVATNIVTRNIGMTSDAVNTLRNELEEANTYGVQAEEVIKTLAMSGLIDMAKNLHVLDARTNEYKDGVAGLVLIMKDLSAAALVDSAEGIDRITRFIRSGNAQYVDGIIEVGNLNFAYKEYADTLGKSLQDLTETERAQARLNVVQEQGKIAFGAYAATMQSAGKLFQSISQKWTQITATIGEALSPIWDTFANGAFQLISAIQSAVGMASGSIKNFAVYVAGYIVIAFRLLGRLLSKIPVIGKNFEGLANFTMKPIKSIGTLANSANNYAGAVNNAANATKGLKKELAGLAPFDELNVLNQKNGTGGLSGGGVGSGGLDFLSPTDETINNWEKLTGFSHDWTDDVNRFADAFTGRMGDLNKPIKRVEDSLGANTGFWGKWKDSVGKAWKESGEEVKIESEKMVLNIWQGMKQTEDNKRLILDPVTKGISSAWAEAGGDVTDQLARMGIKLALFSLTAGNKILEVTNRLNNYLAPALKNIGNWAGEGIQTALTAFLKFTSVGLTVLNGFITWFTTIFKGDWKKAWSDLTTVVNILWYGVKDVIRREINKMILMFNLLFIALNNVNFPGGYKLNIGRIDYLAQGGVIESPTLAMVGEAGREVVMPLENNTEWIDELAGKLNKGGGQTVILKIGEDTIYKKFIDFVNDSTMASNTQLLKI